MTRTDGAPVASYGKVRIGGRTVGAHRYALELHLGRPLVGWALHACDNPPCCNPNPGHLYEGDHDRNVVDKVTRGRQARGVALSAANAHRVAARTHCPHDHPYSDENTYVRPSDGSRHCRTCRREQDRRRR